MEDSMNNKGIKIVLVASIALNLAFVSGFIIKKLKNNSVKPPAETEIGVDLNIQPDQRKSLNQIFGQFRLQTTKFKQDILEKRIEIIEELSNPDIDFQLLNTKTQELNEYENQMNNSFVEILVKINNLLDEKQRLSFLFKLSQNWFFMENSTQND
jgi:hypothetical protein